MPVLETAFTIIYRCCSKTLYMSTFACAEVTWATGPFQLQGSTCGQGHQTKGTLWRGKGTVGLFAILCWGNKPCNRLPTASPCAHRGGRHTAGQSHPLLGAGSSRRGGKPRGLLLGKMPFGWGLNSNTWGAGRRRSANCWN